MYGDNPSGSIKDKSGKSKRSKNDSGREISDDENYGDDFEDAIPEDLPRDDLDIEGSGDHIPNVAKIGESHGITVSQSLGIDPSVDSLALEDYDLIEPVERLQK